MKKTTEQYNDMTQVAAFKIVNALSVFNDLSDDLKNGLVQIVMQRVNLMLHGDQVAIEGDHLVTEIPEPTPEPTTAEEPPTA